MRSAKCLILGLAALIAIGLLLVFVPHVAHNARWRAFFAEKREIEALLEEVRKTPPAGVNPGRWDVAWETTYNAFGNVCFSPDHVSVAEMRRLREDIEQEMAEPPSIEWLRWLWHRLAQTGPHGKRYTDGVILLFDEAVGDASHENKAQNAPKAKDVSRKLDEKGACRMRPQSIAEVVQSRASSLRQR